MTNKNKLSFDTICLSDLIKEFLLEEINPDSLIICNSSGEIVKTNIKEYEEFFPESDNEAESYIKTQNEIKERLCSLCDDYDYYQEQWDISLNKLYKTVILFSLFRLISHCS